MSTRGTKRSTSTDHYHSFLESLIGKTIKIFRKGPEAKQGVLLDVQSDYITVYVQNKKQNTVVYYQLKHVKSISEDSKANSSQKKPKQDNVEFLQANDFNDLLEKFKNKQVQVNQGGPDAKKGLLLVVACDYIILFTKEDGIVYINIDHIKSVSEFNPKKKDNSNKGDNEDNDSDDDGHEDEVQGATDEIPTYVTADDFHDVFASMSHKWVTINSGGPEATEGVLVHSSGGYYTLINNEEVLRVNPSHIRSISAGEKGNKKNNDQGNDSTQGETSDQDKNECKDEKGSNEYKDDHGGKGSKDDKEDHGDKGYDKDHKGHKSSRKRHEPVTRIIKTIDYKWTPKY